MVLFSLCSSLEVPERLRLFLATTQRIIKTKKAGRVVKKKDRNSRKREQTLVNGIKLSEQTQRKRIIQCTKPATRLKTHSQHQRVIIELDSLAYNPITLEYDRNPEGEKLKRLDEDTKIRGYVRAHNMDYKGNSKYNPLTG